MPKNPIEDLKREYDSIPIPEGLNFRVRSSLLKGRTQAKKESKSNMKKNIAKRTAAVAAAAVIVVVGLANSGATVAAAMEKVPVLGAITRVVTIRTYDNATGSGMQAHIDTPQVENGSPELNDSIQAYTDEIVAQYKADVDASGGEGPEAVDLTYQTVTDNDMMFALRFDKTIVMASGNQSVKIYNVDKASGKIMTLDNLFAADSDYQGVISDNIKQQMRDQMAQDNSLTYWLDSDVPAWDFQSVNEESTFYVNADGQLVIVFDEGSVAPMFMGVVEFTIPTDILSSIALPGYLS